MVELVDTLDLKSNEHYVRAGSSPAPGTIKRKALHLFVRLFLWAILNINRRFKISKNHTALLPNFS